MSSTNAIGYINGLKPELRRHWRNKENIKSLDYYICIFVNIDYNNLIYTAWQYIINTHFINIMLASLYTIQCTM